MAFCTNCGHQLADDAKFCFECGAKVDPMSTVQAEQRKMIYDGETHKCPGCGELLNSFISVCPSCGYELRGTKATSALVDFNLKLENANDEKEKMTIIRNYPIPNTKEALFEFMVLASANFDASYHAAHLHEDDISDAWLSKAEQCYQKSKLTFGNSEDLPKIKDMYDKIITNRDLYTQLELQRKEKEQSEKRKKDKVAKRKKLALVLLGVLFVGWLPLLGFVSIFVLIVSGPKEEAKELERLENIVVEVQVALDNEEYKHALRIADSIDYQRYDVEMERKWDIQREYWVDKVLDEAAEKGIVLEYTPTPDIDNANDKPIEEYSGGGFVEGFINGLQPGWEDAKEAIDEFNSVVNGDESEDNQN